MTEKKSSIKPADAVVVVSVALVAAITYWLIMPQLQKLALHRVTAQQQAATAQQLQTRYTTLTSLTDTLPGARQQLDLLSVAYPSGQQTAEAMIQLQSMAARSGIAINSLNPGQARAGLLSITGSFKGTYPGYLTLLHELSTNLRPIAVRSFALTTESEAQRTLLNATITFDFPYDEAASLQLETENGLLGSEGGL